MIPAQILVAEDEGITARDIETRLMRLGYRVPAIAHSGKEAIEKAARTHPDLVLMDIKLKGSMDGVQAAETLRSRFGIPVTYLTAYADDATLTRAQATAPYGYLVKPFDERELHATIQMALYRRRVEQQVEEANRMLTAVNEALVQLTPGEERVLRMRFGIGSKAYGSAQVSKRMGVGRESVRRMARRSVGKLRATASCQRPKPKR